MLSLEQKMSMAQTAHSQFEQAYQLVVAINGPLARNEAWDVARELLREGVDQRHLAEQVQPLRMRLSELEQRLREQQEAERLLADFCKRQGKNFDIDELEALHQELEARVPLFPIACLTPAKSVWHCVRSRNSCSLAFRV